MSQRQAIKNVKDSVDLMSYVMKNVLVALVSKGILKDSEVNDLLNAATLEHKAGKPNIEITDPTVKDKD